MIVYGLDLWYDYEGGGVSSIYSTFELAKDAADRLELRGNESVEILELMINNPNHEGKNLGYYRHGK